MDWIQSSYCFSSVHSNSAKKFINSSSSFHSNIHSYNETIILKDNAVNNKDLTSNPVEFLHSISHQEWNERLKVYNSIQFNSRRFN